MLLLAFPELKTDRRRHKRLRGCASATRSVNLRFSTKLPSDSWNRWKMFGSDRRRHKAGYRTPAPPETARTTPRADPSLDGPISLLLVMPRYRTDGSGVKREVWASGGARPWVEIGGRAQRPGRGEAEPATAGAGMVYEIRPSSHQGHQARCASGGARSAASVTKPIASSIARIVPGSRMVAMSRTRPPHARQITSTSKARCINCAHVQPPRRGGRDAVPLALGGSVAVATVATSEGSTAGAAP